MPGVRFVADADVVAAVQSMAVMTRDYPIVMANLLFFSLLFVIGNLMSDVMYVVVDPRINFDQLSE